MTFKDRLALLTLSALWGASFLFMRITAPVLGPVVLIAARVLLAGLALAAFGAATRRLPSPRAHWKPLLVLGLINTGVPFTLIAAAELRLPASLAATLNATTPLFVSVVAALWLKERLTPRKIGGLFLGLTGVMILVGLGPVPLSLPIVLSIGASLLAAVLYAIAGVFTKVRLQDLPPLALSTYSNLFAAIALLPVVPFTWPHGAVSALVIACVTALALGCTAIAYWIYFSLIESVGPTRAMLVNYLAPAFGMLWGWLFLGEPLGWGMALGFVTIVVSVVLLAAPARTPTIAPTLGRSSG